MTLKEFVWKQKKHKPSWSNDDNREFYRSITEKELRTIAIEGGLHSGCDLNNLVEFWKNASSILEIGAGYGRVIDYLIKHNYQGEITAIEQAEDLYAYLQTCFGQQANVIHANLMNIELGARKFDLILWLWSGLADFPKQHQALVIKKLTKHLVEGGTLIIDTFAMDEMPLYSKQLAKRNYTFCIDGRKKYIYEPNKKEIRKYAIDAGLYTYKCIDCYSDINRKRYLHVLS